MMSEHQPRGTTSKRPKGSARPTLAPPRAEDEHPAVAGGEFSVYFLDMGLERYGDCMLLRMGDRTILIDGAHPKDYLSARWPDHLSIPEQLAKILKSEPPFPLSLLVVTHAHSDHIGCLPALVSQATIKPEYALVCDPDLGWGRIGGENTDEAVSLTALKMSAALREESRLNETDTGLLQDFLDDAASLEPAYRKMLQDLTSMGTQVVRFGTDDVGVKTVLKVFADVGMEIIGPTKEQLQACAVGIHAASRESQKVSDTFISEHSDASLTEVELYKVLAAAQADAADGAPVGSSGPCINDQSIVLKFNFRNKTMFFSGDMQLSEPQFSAVAGDMESLRAAVAAKAPYSLVKFPHHGSFNGINEEIFGDFKSNFFGLCAGIGDPGHPSQQALNILKSHRNEITWARTDKNGLCAFRDNGDSWDVDVAIGAVDDETLNTKEDFGVEPPPAVPPAIPPLTLPAAPEDEDFINVSARVPKRATRVTVTVELQPLELAVRNPFTGAGSHHKAERDMPIMVAGGRPIPKLLFITNGKALRRSVLDSVADVDSLLSGLRSKGHAVFEEITPGAASTNAPAVRARVRLEQPGGVVILGGYDVVPPAILDVLDPPLRSSLSNPAVDADNFIVWNDDLYGDVDGDGFAEFPVSRIPDGRSASLLQAAIAAPRHPNGQVWRGVRNLMRPFADSIWGEVVPGKTLLQSSPVFPTQVPQLDLNGDQVYFMLHGSDADGTRFWGERSDGSQLEAVNLTNVPTASTSVVFTGCCWGALAAEGIASVADPANPPATRTVDNSIALRYLRAGATAFVGCTGSHYSPAPPGGFFGGPMHLSFWTYIRAAQSPAQALLAAKNAYRKAMPHGLTEPVEKAIEKKILWQYTCLGLGW